jgi:hypothetical protein
MSLRELAESDLAVTLESQDDWGLPVELIDPDGVEYTTSANSSDPLNPDPLSGQILYDQLKVDPDTGEPITVDNPIVSLRRSSLTRVPENGERWVAKIPTDPSLTASLETFITSEVRPYGGGQSIGFIKLYLQRIEQS